MGLIFQGWFVGCDRKGCSNVDNAAIGGRARMRAVVDALRAGWLKVKRRGRPMWFCSQECLDEFDGKSVAPTVPDPR
jgi:hypothetical protein